VKEREIRAKRIKSKHTQTMYEQQTGLLLNSNCRNIVGS